MINKGDGIMQDIIKVEIGIMVLKENKILLGHRVESAKDTGGIYEPGSWCLPGGNRNIKKQYLNVQ